MEKKELKKDFMFPELEVIALDERDIIVTSPNEGGSSNEDPYDDGEL